MVTPPQPDPTHPDLTQVHDKIGLAVSIIDGKYE